LTREPIWYPCPLRKPRDDDIIGEGMESNRNILREWIRNPHPDIWREENWLRDEATGYPLYRGPKEHGFPMYKPPKKIKKKTPEPKSDSLEKGKELPR